MTINLTELRDEPLGKHPIQAARLHVCAYQCGIDAEQDVVAADHESSFTFDVDGLSDEALDQHPRYAPSLCSRTWPHEAYYNVASQCAKRVVAAIEIPFDAQIMARCGAGS